MRGGVNRETREAIAILAFSIVLGLVAGVLMDRWGLAPW